MSLATFGDVMRPLVAAAVATLLTLPSIALADDEPAPVVKPAQVLTDPKTGVQQVVVPAGCTSTIQQNGQIVVLCPGTESNPSGRAEAPPEVTTTTERKWYGWQTLMVDGITHGVSTVLLVGAVSAQSEGMLSTAASLYISGYLLGGPIVHWSNGQVGKGFASLGIRAGAPIVLGLTGAALGSGDGDTAGSLAVLGVISGVATAIALDAAVLARKTVTVQRTATPKLQWTPNAAYDSRRQAVTVGVGGTF